MTFTRSTRRAKNPPTPPAAPAALKDNPGLRYRASMEDRHSGKLPGANLAALRATALVTARKLAQVGPAALPAVPGGANWLPLGPLAIVDGHARSSTFASGHR